MAGADAEIEIDIDDMGLSVGLGVRPRSRGLWREGGVLDVVYSTLKTGTGKVGNVSEDDKSVDVVANGVEEEKKKRRKKKKHKK